MKERARFRQLLGDLFQAQRLATLSTQQSGQPYASLVAYCTSDDFRHIYFATPNTTRKYANLTAENRVALLVNSATNQVSDFHRAIAVTAVGEASEVVPLEKDAVLKCYLTRHPYLVDFVRSPTCALIDVAVKSYYMVKNFQNVTELHLYP